MADEQNEKAISSKRVRLSSEGQNKPSDEETRSKHLDEKFLRTKIESDGKENEINDETFEATVNLSDQNGDGNDYELLEKEDSDNFPPCFSVEDVLDDEDQHHFQPVAGPMGWIKRQMDLGIGPRDILTYMAPHAKLPPDVDDSTLWKVVIDILTEPSPRQKLDHVNTIDDVVNLLKRSRNIIVLTGAGVSVSCGIPDFRSRDGVYSKLSVEYPDLPDPQSMFDISYFYNNPRPFFKFAKEIYPGQFKPSLSHRFIKQLESNQQLLRNYSQNIDTLEQTAGISRVMQCHGSFSTASCTNCGYRVASDEIREDIFNQVIPLCQKCPQEKDVFAVMKPDIVFFGESLPGDFYLNLENDSQKADLLIVVGSSLKVRPVALVPSHISPEVPQILINREPLRHMTFDVELLGDCDVILAHLCERLGGTWKNVLLDYKVPPVDARLLCCIETPPPEYLHNVSPTEGERDSDKSLGIHPVENVKNQKNLEPPCNRNSTDISGSKDKVLACNSDSNLADSDCGCLITDSEPSDGGICEESSGKSVSLHRYSPSTIFHDIDNDPPRFIFMPPSRFLFYGSEVFDSPLPSPDTRLLSCLHGSIDSSSDDYDDNYDYDNDDEMVEYQYSISTSSMDGSNCDIPSDGNNIENVKRGSGADIGGLSIYTSESEDSSAMSFGDVYAGETMSKKETLLESDGKRSTGLPIRSLHTKDIPEKRTSSDAKIIKASYADGEQLYDDTAFRKAAFYVENFQGSVPAATNQEGSREKIDPGEEQKLMVVDCCETLSESTPVSKNYPTVLRNVNMHHSAKESSTTSSSNSDQGRYSPGEESILCENDKQFNSITNCL